MARIVLTCWGSHGDIDPFLGLGLGLHRRGHHVTIATLKYYRSLVEASGLAFGAIRPAIDPLDTHLIERIMHRSRGSEFLLTEILFPGVEAMFDDISAAAEGADLLIVIRLRSRRRSSPSIAAFRGRAPCSPRPRCSPATTCPPSRRPRG